MNATKTGALASGTSGATGSMTQMASRPLSSSPVAPELQICNCLAPSRRPEAPATEAVEGEGGAFEEDCQVQIRIRNAYGPPCDPDGRRVPVYRLRPRDMKKAAALVGAWHRRVAPSDARCDHLTHLLG